MTSSQIRGGHFQQRFFRASTMLALLGSIALPACLVDGEDDDNWDADSELPDDDGGGLVDDAMFRAGTQDPPQGVPPIDAQPEATSISMVDYSTVIESFWFRDGNENVGFVRECPYYSAQGIIDWDACDAPSDWTQHDDSALDGVGDCANDVVQAQSNVVVGNKYIQSYWICDEGYTREVPIVNGVIQWGSAPAWSAPVSVNALPGSGSIQSQSNFVVCNHELHQTFWRGGQGFRRTVPIVNGAVAWNQASAFSGPTALSSLPGTGAMQAQATYLTGNLAGNALHQTYWRSGVEYHRTMPVSYCEIQWGSATPFTPARDMS